MITMYGIPNCDTIKKAKKWLNANQVDFDFHDYKKAGVDPSFLKDVISAAGIDVVVNKRGTTFRKLSEQEKAVLTNNNLDQVITLLCENPSMIKRPILCKQEITNKPSFLVGFNETTYQEFINAA